MVTIRMLLERIRTAGHCARMIGLLFLGLCEFSGRFD